MKYLVKKITLLALMVLFLGISSSMPLSLGPIGIVSAADAHHKPGHTCNGSQCGPAPTVSELPIRYMVPGGLAVILIAGGIVYLVRTRGKKNSLEA